MLKVRYVQAQDKEFWFRLDKHLSEREFKNKVRDKQGYVLLEDNQEIGILRYNLFWDNTPFCTLLFVDENAQHFYRKLGYKDCGGFVIDIPKYAQPMELFMVKAI